MHNKTADREGCVFPLRNFYKCLSKHRLCPKQSGVYLFLYKSIIEIINIAKVRITISSS